MTSPDAYGKTIRSQDLEPRCWRCARMLARAVTRPWAISCPRCKATNADGGKGPDPQPR